MYDRILNSVSYLCFSLIHKHTHTHTLCVQHQWLNPGHNPANVRHILTSFQWNFKRFHIWTVFLHSVCVSNAHKNLLCTLTAHSRVFIEECPYIGVGGKKQNTIWLQYDYKIKIQFRHSVAFLWANVFEGNVLVSEVWQNTWRERRGRIFLKQGCQLASKTPASPDPMPL